ncbi:MAG: HYR domain-containing protein, partial [Saprospiraceae bacterium]|nr:HYR domain-containing protein [Saprospiraceae bacterium]
MVEFSSHPYLSLTSGLGSGGVFPLGTSTETYTVTDAAGNSASCSFTVTVNDTEDPVISCPSDITVNNEMGTCGANMEYAAPSYSDNCGSVTIALTGGIGNSSFFPVGSTTEEYTATDAAGNTASCSFTVTVNDTEDPEIACPADITVSNDPGQCSAVVNYMSPSGMDNCPGAILVQTTGLGGGSSFPVGSTTETYQVTDAAGNTISCSFTVTVNDTQNPTIACPADFTVSNDAGQCSAVVLYEIPLGSDNCPGAATAQTGGLGSGSAFPIGATTNTFEVTDAAGNTASCSFTITVKDTQNPAIACPADIVTDNDVDQCSAVVNYLAPTGTDNCPGATTVQTVGLGSGSAFPVGTTTETFTVADAAGNMASCSFTVTVNDAQDPDISCSPDIVVDNATDLCGAYLEYGAPSYSDNCPGVTIALTAGIGNTSFFPVGATTEEYTATDAAGNTASCSFTVTVIDNQAPTIACPADISVDNDAGECGADVTVPLPVITSDNCLIMEEDFNAGALPAGWSNNAVGTNATATWSFGVDTEGPLINGTGSIDGTNMAFFDDDDFDTDGGEAVELISPAVDLTGYSSVLLTFDYIYWHLNTSYFKVEVWDGVAWQTILLVDNDQVHNVLVNGAFDVSAYLNSAFQIRFTYDDGGEWAWSVAVDNIALYGASVSNDQTSNAAASGFYPVGTTTVNYTVTDLAGNSTTCSL